LMGSWFSICTLPDSTCASAATGFRNGRRSPVLCAALDGVVAWFNPPIVSLLGVSLLASKRSTSMTAVTPSSSVGDVINLGIATVLASGSVFCFVGDGLVDHAHQKWRKTSRGSAQTMRAEVPGAIGSWPRGLRSSFRSTRFKTTTFIANLRVLCVPFQTFPLGQPVEAWMWQTKPQRKKRGL